MTPPGYAHPADRSNHGSPLWDPRERNGCLRHGDWVRGASEVEGATGLVVEPFEEFFHHERPRLFGTLVLIVGDRGVAEDLMQEAFARVWEHWDRVQAHPDPPGYLYRTALNLVRLRRRRILRAPKEQAEPQQIDAMAAVDAKQDLYAALGRLTPRQRAALVLTELLDLDAKQAGKVLGVRPETVRSLASQGRAALRMRGLQEDE
jgi:RNA polymerase sigma factor (sigma-70 family)